MRLLPVFCCLSFLFIWLSGVALAQQKPVSTPLLTAANWHFPPQTVTFNSTKEGPLMSIGLGAGQVTARAVKFTNGTIEFDVRPQDTGMSFFFRWQSASENEGFYLRMDRAGQPEAADGVQYAPYVGGVLLWNLLGHFQTKATFTGDAWNHVKVVVSGAQLQLFINSSTLPTLAVDQLAGTTQEGTIGFEGAMQVRGLHLTTDVAGLSPEPGVDPTATDLRYVRRWGVSDPIATPEGVDFSESLLPTPDTHWQMLATESRGLLNLTRAFGSSKPRRIVWLKATVTSVTAQARKVDLGFVDDVWVYLNGQLAYVDKNRYGSPIAKVPAGRCAVENTTFTLPLKVGKNELLIGVASNFYGWGAITRFVNLDDIEITPDTSFDTRLVDLAAGLLDEYVGGYTLPDGRSVSVTKETGRLRLSGSEFIKTWLYPASETSFFSREYELTFGFVKAAGTTSELVIYRDGKPLMALKRTN